MDTIPTPYRGNGLTPTEHAYVFPKDQGKRDEIASGNFKTLIESDISLDAIAKLHPHITVRLLAGELLRVRRLANGSSAEMVDDMRMNLVRKGWVNERGDFESLDGQNYIEGKFGEVDISLDGGFAFKDLLAIAIYGLSGVKGEA